MQDASFTNKFKKIVAITCNNWQIPNITYALIKDNQVIDIQSCLLNNPFLHTPSAEKLFRIGSNSKSFVCTALIELEKQGKLSLDDNVTNYLPNFKMNTDELTQKVKVRNLVTHSTGIGKFTSCLLGCLGYPQQSIIDSLPHIKQIGPFNASFQYNNALYVVAGKLIEKVIGMDCNGYFKKQFFMPLGMTNTFTSIGDVYQPSLALPHIEYNKKNFPVSQNPISETFFVAGNVISTASDLAKWLLFNLQITTSHKKELAYYQKLFQPQVPIIQPININHLNRYLKATAYLMGWQQLYFNKYKIFDHIGVSTGYVSSLSFCPELRCGLVILANKGDIWHQIGLLLVNFYELITRNRCTNLFPVIQEQCEKFKTAVNAEISSFKPQPLPANFCNISLSYNNAMYGKITIRSSAKEIFLQIGPKNINILLEYVGDNKFKLIDENFIFWEQFKLIMLTIHDDKKAVTMEIFMDNQHGSLTWIDTQFFNRCSF